MLSDIEVVPAMGPVKLDSPTSVCRTIWSYFLLSRKAKELLRSRPFDVCHVEFTETGFFLTPPRVVPSILTCHDIIAKPAFRRYSSSRGILRIAAWGSWRMKQVLEKLAVSGYRKVFTLSEEDLRWAERLYPGIPFRVLSYPGGIDYTGLIRTEIPNRILFLGAMNRPANLEAIRFFVREAWPAIRKEVPEAELVVAGGGMPDALKKELAPDSRVTLAGFVERIEDAYKAAAVFVAPILAGGGIIVKILDAMAAGVPVVTTSFGNEGIRARPGEEVLVADRPEDFSSCVVRLLRDPSLRAAIGSAGKRHVERNYSADGLEATIEKAYQEIHMSNAYTL